MNFAFKSFQCKSVFIYQRVDFNIDFNLFVDNLKNLSYFIEIFFSKEYFNYLIQKNYAIQKKVGCF